MGGSAARAAAALVVVAGLLGPATARAEAVDEGTAAFLEGVRLFDAGDYETALVSFRRALALHPHPAVLVNIAWCHSRLDDPVAALEAFEEYLERAEGEPDERVGPARAEAARLRGLVGEVTLRVAPDEAEVLVDGVAVDARGRAEPLRLRAGSHRVLARLEGHAERAEEVVVLGGGRRTVEIVLEESPGSLAVRASPSGARITVDGLPFAASPAPTSAGSHHVSATAPRRAPWHEDVTVEAGRLTTVEVSLARRGLRSVWFWTAFGLTAGCVAIATVTGSLAFHYRDRWVDEWREQDRRIGEGLRNSTDFLALLALGGAVASLVLGLYTSFTPPRSTAEITVEDLP